MMPMLRIAAYPFASSGNIRENLSHLLMGMKLAAAHQVQLLVFHECALCGYPPVETPLDAVDESENERKEALHILAEKCREYRLHVLLGDVRTENGQRFNTVYWIASDGKIQPCYDKKALWGWDRDHFAPGQLPGLLTLEGIRIGVRVCFDVRFPELFRPFFRQQIPLCILLMSDTTAQPDPERYALIAGHIRSRAAENVMTVLSVNSLSRNSGAPTAVFDQNGRIAAALEPGQEDLLCYDFSVPEVDFGMLGRMTCAREFMTEKNEE